MATSDFFADSYGCSPPPALGHSSEHDRRRGQYGNCGREQRYVGVRLQTKPEQVPFEIRHSIDLIDKPSAICWSGRICSPETAVHARSRDRGNPKQTYICAGRPDQVEHKNADVDIRTDLPHYMVAGVARPRWVRCVRAIGIENSWDSAVTERRDGEQEFDGEKHSVPLSLKEGSMGFEGFIRNSPPVPEGQSRRREPRFAP
jgi:hypothetical protein